MTKVYGTKQTAPCMFFFSPFVRYLNSSFNLQVRPEMSFVVSCVNMFVYITIHTAPYVGLFWV